MECIPFSIDRLNDMCQLWNRELGRDFPMRYELFKQNTILDRNLFRNGSWITVDRENKVTGFIISKMWNEEDLNVDFGRGTGWIQVLTVASNYRNSGVGTSLLRKAENAFKQREISKIVLGKDPWHFFPGIPFEYDSVKTWFERRGYAYTHRVYDMYRNYSAEEPCRLSRRRGIRFYLMGECAKGKLLAFLNRCFPGRWEYEAIQYFERGGTGREYVIFEINGEIKGFCRINDSRSPFIAQNTYWAPLFDSELGGIGPLGIDPELRGRGYGTALVQAGIYFLRKRGIQHVVIDWTDLTEFYGKLGYRVWKSYGQYEKDLLTTDQTVH